MEVVEVVLKVEWKKKKFEISPRKKNVKYKKD